MLSKSQTKWARLDALEKVIDMSGMRETKPQKFAKAVVRRGLKPVPPNAQVTLRVDRDVLDWF